MEFVLGVLHWTPKDFWNSTFYEVSCAWAGHARANGLGPWAVGPHGWSEIMVEEHRAEVDELKKRIESNPRFTTPSGGKKWRNRPSIN